jgi:hypothetical protein
MSCWQPKLEPGPRLDQFEASVRVRSTFLTDFFLFLCRKFTFGGPETGSEKKQLEAGFNGHHTNRFELDLEVARTHFEHSETSVQSRNNSNGGP